ncbi:hypothetical protein BJY59DRAFT_319124 [Rhodotorula toruloides]
MVEVAQQRGGRHGRVAEGRRGLSRLLAASLGCSTFSVLEGGPVSTPFPAHSSRRRCLRDARLLSPEKACALPDLGASVKVRGPRRERRNLHEGLVSSDHLAALLSLLSPLPLIYCNLRPTDIMWRPGARFLPSAQVGIRSGGQGSSAVVHAHHNVQSDSEDDDGFAHVHAKHAYENFDEVAPHEIDPLRDVAASFLLEMFEELWRIMKPNEYRGDNKSDLLAHIHRHCLPSLLKHIPPRIHHTVAPETVYIAWLYFVSDSGRLNSMDRMQYVDWALKERLLPTPGWETLEYSEDVKVETWADCVQLLEWYRWTKLPHIIERNKAFGVHSRQVRPALLAPSWKRWTDHLKRRPPTDTLRSTNLNARPPTSGFASKTLSTPSLRCSLSARLNPPSQPSGPARPTSGSKTPSSRLSPASSQTSGLHLPRTPLHAGQTTTTASTTTPTTHTRTTVASSLCTSSPRETNFTAASYTRGLATRQAFQDIDDVSRIKVDAVWMTRCRKALGLGPDDVAEGDGGG